MHNGRCSKCGSAEVYQNATAARLPFKGGISYRDATIATYICLACGYFEPYVNFRDDDTNLADAIRKNWQKVPPR